MLEIWKKVVSFRALRNGIGHRLSFFDNLCPKRKMNLLADIITAQTFLDRINKIDMISIQGGNFKTTELTEIIRFLEGRSREFRGESWRVEILQTFTIWVNPFSVCAGD